MLRPLKPTLKAWQISLKVSCHRCQSFRWNIQLSAERKCVPKYINKQHFKNKGRNNLVPIYSSLQPHNHVTLKARFQSTYYFWTILLTLVRQMKVQSPQSSMPHWCTALSLCMCLGEKHCQSGWHCSSSICLILSFLLFFWASKQRMRAWWEEKTRPPAMSFLLLSRLPLLPLSWSICRHRGSHESLDQSNHRWDQVWREGRRQNGAWM